MPKAPAKTRKKAEIAPTGAIEKKRGRGHPRAFEDPAALQTAVEAYMLYSDETFGHLPNVAGLASFIGVHRDTILEYSKKPEYSGAIKHFWARVEDKWIQRLGRAQAAGAIFYMKNALKDYYKDDSRMDNGNGSTTNIFILPREIAEKHNLALTEAPVHEEVKVIEPEEPGDNDSLPTEQLGV